MKSTIIFGLVFMLLSSCSNAQTNELSEVIHEYGVQVSSVETRDSVYWGDRFESELLPRLDELVLTVCEEGGEDLAMEFCSAAIKDVGNANENLWHAFTRIYCCRTSMVEKLLGASKHKRHIIDNVIFIIEEDDENSNIKCPELYQRMMSY